MNDVLCDSPLVQVHYAAAAAADIKVLPGIYQIGWSSVESDWAESVCLFSRYKFHLICVPCSFGRSLRMHRSAGHGPSRWRCWLYICSARHWQGHRHWNRQAGSRRAIQSAPPATNNTNTKIVTGISNKLCLTFSKAPHSLGIPIHQIHFSSITLTGLEPLHPYWKLFGVEWTQMHEGGRYICRASIRARGKVGAEAVLANLCAHCCLEF